LVASDLAVDGAALVAEAAWASASGGSSPSPSPALLSSPLLSFGLELRVESRTRLLEIRQQSNRGQREEEEEPLGLGHESCWAY
jgi:hypothetical protein